MTISRRTFIKQSAATAAIGLAAGTPRQVLAASAPAFAPGPGNKWPGRVAINFNKEAVRDGATPQPVIIQAMVDDAVKALTGKTSVGEAWKEVFPATLSLRSKIAIKINTVNTQLPGPHKSSVKAITDGLQAMDIGGTKFPAANITIYDMNFQDGMAKLGYVQDYFPGITLEHTVLADGGDGAMNNHTYAASLKNADFLINVFSPRGHTAPPEEKSKFSLGFKSHIGTYASEAKYEGPSLHGSKDTYDRLLENLRDMNCTGVVYKKNVLSMCSGIFGLNEGVGPPGQAQDYKNYAKTMDSSITGTANPTTIMLSTDPVAIEMQAIKMMRINKNKAYTPSDMPPYLQASAGISGKMTGSTYNIGILEESKMDLRRVVNGTTLVDRPSVRPAARSGGIAVSTLRDNATFFEFMVSGVVSGTIASVGIYRLDGRLVHEREVRLMGIANHFSWDNRGINGERAGRGAYVVRIECGALSTFRQFSLIR